MPPPHLSLSRGDSRATSAFPVPAGVSGGFLTLRRPLRRREVGKSPDLRSGGVDRVWLGRILGGGAETGRPPSLFCWAAASPRFRCRLRRRRMAAASPGRRFLRRRWWVRGWCLGGRKGGFKTAASQVRGKKVEDLWCRPQIWCSLSSGCAPGRCSFFVVRSSSSELVALAALQRLLARGSAAPVLVDLGGWSLRRLRRRSVRASGDLEDEDGVSELRCSLFPLFACACTCLYFVLFSV